jgi:L-asparaginase II
MSKFVPMVEVWRGDILECVHNGQAVVVDGSGQIVEAWGEPESIILPRSSSKMIQALPLIESGAADTFGLTTEQLALSCASHNGAHIHTDRVTAWMSDLGLGDDDFRCGPQVPADAEARDELVRAHEKPCQVHNNCSGKHAGFLTLSKHLGGDAEYLETDHPVQKAIHAAQNEITDMESPGFGIDGCSAPNFAGSLCGVAKAMAFCANAEVGKSTRDTAAVRLRNAMMTHPELVAGEGRACTELMREMNGKGAIKTGADGVFFGILPEKGLGIALKIQDGATRGSECAMAALLAKYGALDPASAAARKRMNAPLLNRRDIDCGIIKPAASLT